MTDATKPSDAHTEQPSIVYDPVVTRNATGRLVDQFKADVDGEGEDR